MCKIASNLHKWPILPIPRFLPFKVLEKEILKGLAFFKKIFTL